MKSCLTPTYEKKIDIIIVNKNTAHHRNLNFEILSIKFFCLYEIIIMIMNIIIINNVDLCRPTRMLIVSLV